MKYEEVSMPEEFYTKKEYESVVIKTLGNSPKLRMVDFFLDNPLFDFTKKEVIEALGMSKQTFYKYFPDLEEYGIVEVSRRIGRAKLYKINLEHPLVTTLREYEKKVSLQMAQKEAVKLRKPIPAK
jgi:DNA-binding transcriptional ArsR family regulator